MNKKNIIAAMTIFTVTIVKAQTAQEVVKDMAPGWNLGNTMEVPRNSLDAETTWQDTKTSQAIIDYVKSQGFKSVRIPCSWYAHFDNGTTNINATWMARVKEVVDYCIKDGLYVLLNDHWDGGWLENSFNNLEETNISAKCDTLKAIWTQISEVFKEYDNHLLFAGLNEPAAENAQQVAALTRYEQTFIDAVRTSGGKNAERILVTQGPVTDIDKTYDLMNTLPTDPVKDKLAIEVHYYAPWQFWGMMQDESWGNMFFYWGEGNHVTGSKHNATYGEEDYIRKQLDKMKTKFSDNGIPVIIGEYGANWRTVTGNGESQEKHNASIKSFYKTFNEEAIKRGMAPMAWCTNYRERPSMTIIDRANLSVYNTYAMEGIKEAVTATRIEVIGQNGNIVTGSIDTTVYDICGNVRAKDVSSLDEAELSNGIYIYKGKKFKK